MKKVNFSKAITALEEGKIVKRENSNSFIFKQIPADIDKIVIHRMQSLPELVKDLFQLRYKNIHYRNQYCIVDYNNTITSYYPNQEDIEATDWIIYKNKKDLDILNKEINLDE